MGVVTVTLFDLVSGIGAHESCWEPLSKYARRCPPTTLSVLECQPRSLGVQFSISRLHTFTGLAPLFNSRYFFKTHVSLVLVFDCAIGELTCFLLFHFGTLFREFSTVSVYATSFEDFAKLLTHNDDRLRKLWLVPSSVCTPPHSRGDSRAPEVSEFGFRYLICISSFTGLTPVSNSRYFYNTHLLLLLAFDCA